MSKQLAISSAASIMAMAAFAVLASPVPASQTAFAAYEKGAPTEVAAPLAVETGWISG